jgi:L-lactate dehydrogenase
MTDALRRYPAAELIALATDLLAAAELDRRHAACVAETLVAGDCLNRASHGIAAVPRYAAYLEKGQMAKSGVPEIIADGGATVHVDGGMLPGPVVAHAAVKTGVERAAQHGVATVVARRAHHIACLGTYLERATERGMAIVMVSSNPGVKLVAPYGGTKAVYSPNPLAVGLPTEEAPILVDFSSSSVSANVCKAMADAGETLPEALLLDAAGRPTSDPAALFTSPPGALMPFGGAHAGYKGFALGLMIEALTSGLAGAGRATPEARFSNAVFVMVIDPARFAGVEALRREMSFLADAAHAAGEPGQVRLPGEQAQAYRARALAEGVPVAAATIAALAGQAAAAGVALPASLR